MFKHKYSNIFLYFLFWLLIGIIFAAQSYVYLQYKGLTCTFIGTVIEQLPNFILWGFYTPLILWLTKIFPFDEIGKIKRSILVHFFSALVLSSLHMVIYTSLLVLIYGLEEGLTFFSLLFVLVNYWFYFQFIFYAAVLILGIAINYYRKFREKETASLQLEKLLADAKLASLKMQLHPHFLFNTMNNISMLVRQNKNEEAVKIISLLSDLLRHALQHKEAKLISLKEEMELSEKYLKIEKIRFEGRLSYKIAFDETLGQYLIPDLITQPVIENAIKHGINDKVENAFIKIEAKCIDDKLIIIIEDNGKGYNHNTNNNNGFGLKITQERIEKIFGREGILIIESKENFFTKVTIKLPAITEE